MLLKRASALIPRQVKKRIKYLFGTVRGAAKQFISSPLLLRRLRKQSGLRLHLGCGGQHLAGYVNIDTNPRSAADVVISAVKLPFIDGQASEIFTSHMIEHIPREEFSKTIAEWHRVLCSGGQLVIRCPNFELYVREWLEGDYEWRWSWGLRPIFGFEGRGSGMWHLNAFTVDRLDRLMTEMGFRTIKCEATETRPFTIGTFEYREQGDILYIGERI